MGMRNPAAGSGDGGDEPLPAQSMGAMNPTGLWTGQAHGASGASPANHDERR